LLFELTSTTIPDFFSATNPIYVLKLGAELLLNIFPSPLNEMFHPIAEAAILCKGTVSSLAWVCLANTYMPECSKPI
jgi:hypothetical protein